MKAFLTMVLLFKQKTAERCRKQQTEKMIRLVPDCLQTKPDKLHRTGHFRLPDKDRARLRHIIWDYINHSEEMVMLMVLLDSRHPMQEVDLRFISELGEKGIPFGLIFTKADKQGTEALERQVEENKGRLLEDWEELPPCFVSSSANGTGREEILNYIGTILTTL